MNDIKDLDDKAAIDKLKSLVSDINICLFCTNLKTDDGATCRPMSAQHVCDQGNIWFFSEKNSDKNREIALNKNVQLFFAHPGKGSYLIVSGAAEIIIDKEKTEELWSPVVKAWFPGGKDDPNLSIIKVKPTTAYYWDTDGNRMVNFIKIAAAMTTGSEVNIGSQGELTV